MKKIFKIVGLLVMVILTSQIQGQNIAINSDGTDADSTAILDLKTNNKGLLIPRLTTTQMNSISGPATGLLIYNKLTNLFMANIGTPASPIWAALGDLGSVSGPSLPSVATGTSGTNFNIVTSFSDPNLTFNIPYASTSAKGLITDSTQTIGGKKTFADTLTAGSALLLSSLSSGSGTDSLLTVDANTGAIKKRTPSDFFNNTPVNSLTFMQDNFEDFVFDSYSGSGSNDNQFAFTQSVSGTNAKSDIDGLSDVAGNDYAGMDTMYTGTTSTGKAGLGAFNFINRIKLGGKQIVYEARVKIPILSDGTNTFTTYIGMADFGSTAASLFTTTDPINGIYFKYNNTLNSGKWTAICRKASITYPTGGTNTGITVAANTWYKLKAVISSDASKVDYYIDGVLVGSYAVQANFPSAAMKFIFKIEKSNGGTGRSFYVDYLGWRMVR